MLQLSETTVSAPGIPACMPKTRIGPSAVFGETRTEVLPFLSVTSHRACGDSWPETASDLFLFIQEDPLRLGGGQPSLYLYTRGDPTAYVDPTGLKGEWYDIRSTMEFYQNISEDRNAPYAQRAGADVAMFLLNSFGMTNAQKLGEYAGSGQAACAVVQASVIALKVATIMSAQSGLKHAGEWVKNPAMYELGAKTVGTEVFSQISNLSTIERGRWLWKTLGWKALGISRGPWLTTLAQGPTPGGWMGLAAVTAGANKLGDLVSCWCDIRE